MKKIITAKFDSTCAETGRPIKKGDPMVYDYSTKKCYASGSPTQQKFVNEQHDQGGDMLDESIEQHHENWYRQEYRDY